MKELNVIELLSQASLVVKLVLTLLIAMSLISWAIFFFKWMYYVRVKRANRKFLKAYHNAESLSELVGSLRSFSPSCYALSFSFAYQSLKRLAEGLEEQENRSLAQHFKEYGFSYIERSLRKGLNDFQKKFKSRMDLLASVGSLSPFIGLFGTVWGIVNSFQGLSLEGANLQSIAPGIAEALVATAIGLLVAIPAVFFFNKLQQLLTKSLDDLEVFSEGFINWVERHMDGDLL